MTPTDSTLRAPEPLPETTCSENFTLTAQEIRHLAQFCGMILHDPTASEAEEEHETEIIIAPWPEKGVQGDDGMLPPYKHIAYLAEYPEEGYVPLGSPNTVNMCNPVDANTPGSA